MFTVRKAKSFVGLIHDLLSDKGHNIETKIFHSASSRGTQIIFRLIYWWVSCDWWVSDQSYCDEVCKTKLWFWKRIWDENAYNFLVISSLLHDWLSPLEHTGHMCACWFLGLTGCLGFSNNPRKMMRTHAQTELYVGFCHLILVPFMGFGVSPVRGRF